MFKIYRLMINIMRNLNSIFIHSIYLSMASVSIAFATEPAMKADPVADAKKICHYQAVEKSGYDPDKANSGKTVAKGAGAGAAGGTAVRAIQGKSLLKGAAVGAAAGAAVGGVKKNKDKKQAVAGEANYKTEYDSCLRSRGLVPENVR